MNPTDSNPTKTASPEYIANALISQGDWAPPGQLPEMRGLVPGAYFGKDEHPDAKVRLILSKSFIADNGGREAVEQVTDVIRSKIAGAASMFNEKTNKIEIYADPAALAVAKHGLQQEQMDSAIETALNSERARQLQRTTSPGMRQNR